MTVTKKHYSKCSVFAFDFETPIKTILPLINRLINVALLVANLLFNQMLRQLIDVPRWFLQDKHVPACRFQSVSPGSGALV